MSSDIQKYTLGKQHISPVNKILIGIRSWFGYDYLMHVSENTVYVQWKKGQLYLNKIKIKNNFLKKFSLNVSA